MTKKKRNRKTYNPPQKKAPNKDNNNQLNDAKLKLLCDDYLRNEMDRAIEYMASIPVPYEIMTDTIKMYLVCYIKHETARKQAFPQEFLELLDKHCGIKTPIPKLSFKAWFHAERKE